MAAGQREPTRGVARLILEAAGDEDERDEEDRRGREVRREAVLRDVDADREARRHHPPAEHALKAAEDEEDRQRGRELPRKATLKQEDSEGNCESESDHAAEEPVRPLPPEDVLEVGEREVEVLALVLGDLLVGLELGVPVGGRQRRQHAGDRLPLGDREPGVGEARDAAERDHREDHRRKDVEPDAHGAQPVGGSVGEAVRTAKVFPFPGRVVSGSRRSWQW